MLLAKCADSCFTSASNDKAPKGATIWRCLSSGKRTLLVGGREIERGEADRARVVGSKLLAEQPAGKKWKWERADGKL